MNLTRKQKQTLDYLAAYQNQNGYCPSFDEIKNHLNLQSKSGVHRLLTALEDRGHIRRRKHLARSIEITAPRTMLALPAPTGEGVTSRLIDRIVGKMVEAHGDNDGDGVLIIMTPDEVRTILAKELAQ